MVFSDFYETATAGFSNGISTQLANKLIVDSNTNSLTDLEKDDIVENAAFYYGKFLSALGVDWENDPNSKDTPKRVAKAYVHDLWAGRYSLLDNNTITTFPSDNYNGIILEKDIPIISMCSHHHQTILGKCHIAYIPQNDNESQVLGLSKLNRIVNHFSRRGIIQEQLTVAIHNALNQILIGNAGILVIVHSFHNCVSCRGVRHIGTSMVTSEVSGVFSDHSKTAKAEVYSMISLQLDGYR
jgi:GTP cyclohydrolase I